MKKLLPILLALLLVLVPAVAMAAPEQNGKSSSSTVTENLPQQNGLDVTRVTTTTTTTYIDGSSITDVDAVYTFSKPAMPSNDAGVSPMDSNSGSNGIVEVDVGYTYTTTVFPTGTGYSMTKHNASGTALDSSYILVSLAQSAGWGSGTRINASTVWLDKNTYTQTNSTSSPNSGTNYSYNITNFGSAYTGTPFRNVATLTYRFNLGGSNSTFTVSCN